MSPAFDRYGWQAQPITQEQPMDDHASAPIPPLATIEEVRAHLEDAQKQRALHFAAVRGEVALLSSRVAQIDAGQAEILRRQDEHAAALRANTEVTEQVRDFLTTARTGGKLVKWAGGVAGAVAGFVTLYFAWPHK